MILCCAAPPCLIIYQYLMREGGGHLPTIPWGYWLGGRLVEEKHIQSLLYYDSFCFSDTFLCVRWVWGYICHKKQIPLISTWNNIKCKIQLQKTKWIMINWFTTFCVSLCSSYLCIPPCNGWIWPSISKQ